MALISTWEQRGIELGIKRGKEEMLAFIFQFLFSILPDDLPSRLNQLTSDQLNELGRALFEFSSITDLEQWLNQHEWLVLQ